MRCYLQLVEELVTVVCKCSVILFALAVNLCENLHAINIFCNNSDKISNWNAWIKIWLEKIMYLHDNLYSTAHKHLYIILKYIYINSHNFYLFPIKMNFACLILID